MGNATQGCAGRGTSSRLRLMGPDIGSGRVNRQTFWVEKRTETMALSTVVEETSGVRSYQLIQTGSASLCPRVEEAPGQDRKKICATMSPPGCARSCRRRDWLMPKWRRRRNVPPVTGPGERCGKFSWTRHRFPRRSSRSLFGMVVEIFNRSTFVHGVKFVMRRDDNRKRGPMKHQKNREGGGRTNESGF